MAFDDRLDWPFRRTFILWSPKILVTCLVYIDLKPNTRLLLAAGIVVTHASST